MSKSAAIGLSITLLLAGCHSILPDTIEQNDYDSSGRFNGTWILQANDVLGNCRHNFTRAYVTVKAGVAKTSQGKGYVSHTGDFKIRDDVFYNSKKATRVYAGNLIEAKGRVIVDYRRFNTTDCSISFSIQKQK